MARIPLAASKSTCPGWHARRRPLCRHAAGPAVLAATQTPRSGGSRRWSACSALHCTLTVSRCRSKKRSLCGRGTSRLGKAGERGARLQLRDRAAECVACTAKRRCPPPLRPSPMRPLGRWAAAPLLLAVVAACMQLPTSAAARTLAQVGPAAAAPAPAQAAAAGGSREDAALLLAFKDSLDNGDEVLTDWQLGSDPCAWTGISCKANGEVDSM